MARKGETGVEYKLTIREEKFVAYYIESGDAQKAVKKAGFRTTSPLAYSRKLLKKPKIQAELKKQMSELKNECFASGEEIRIFLTHVMRGEIKDQFGLDSTIADRLKAADALAKRIIDMEAIANKAEDNKITVNVVWDRSNDITAPNLPTEEEDEE